MRRTRVYSVDAVYEFVGAYSVNEPESQGKHATREGGGDGDQGRVYKVLGDEECLFEAKGSLVELPPWALRAGGVFSGTKIWISLNFVSDPKFSIREETRTAALGFKSWRRSTPS